MRNALEWEIRFIYLFPEKVNFLVLSHSMHENVLTQTCLLNRLRRKLLKCVCLECTAEFLNRHFAVVFIFTPKDVYNSI
jgi:hypothetical protein